jgi:hypothetical protein
VNMTFIWMAIWIFIIVSIVLQVRAGIKAGRTELDLKAKEFPSVDPRNFENWQWLIREAYRKSYMLLWFLILCMSSFIAGFTVFLYIFIPTSIFIIYIYYRIWRVPNEYLKILGITKKDVMLVRKKPWSDSTA